ncbi:MAG TPA: NAD(P) transhydrogenase subunit alpha [Candidatus Dormibacteraeota bacterium]
MSTLLTNITILVLAAFVGFEVISKVPTTLHTPLMSGTNAIHGIVIVGGLLTVGALAGGWIGTVLGTVAVIFGTINVVGGFLVTDRMLEMFKGRRPPPRTPQPDPSKKV